MKRAGRPVRPPSGRIVLPEISVNLCAMLRWIPENRLKFVHVIAQPAHSTATQPDRLLKPFVFTRIQYTSGDWDTDQRMPVNLLHSLVEYTTIPVDQKERVVRLGHPDLFRSPFCYLSGHKLVEFSQPERDQFKRYVQNGGFVFADDCNHDIDGLFAKSFEQEMARTFGPKALQKIPNNHPIYSSFFSFPDGPPTTSFELNGWGDDLVHDYLKAIVVNGRIGVLYSNKDYGCEWDYDFRNKRFLAEDNTKFGVNIVTYALTV